MYLIFKHDFAIDLVIMIIPLKNLTVNEMQLHRRRIRSRSNGRITNLKNKAY